MMGDSGCCIEVLFFDTCTLLHRCFMNSVTPLTQCLTLYLSDPIQVANSRQAGRQHPEWWMSDPSSGARPGQMAVNAGPRIKGKDEVCNPLPKQGMWHVLHGGAGGYSLVTTQAGVRHRLGKGDACTVEGGMVGGEEVGGRV